MKLSSKLDTLLQNLLTSINELTDELLLVEPNIANLLHKPISNMSVGDKIKVTQDLIKILDNYNGDSGEA